MEVSGQPYALATLSPVKGPTWTPRIGEFVVPRACVNSLEKGEKKSLVSPLNWTTISKFCE
jgi:hypothetical protein